MEMILTAGKMCRLYILYDNCGPLFSGLFLSSWVISFEWFISEDEKRYRDLRELEGDL